MKFFSSVIHNENFGAFKTRTNSEQKNYLFRDFVLSLEFYWEIWTKNTIFILRIQQQHQMDKTYKCEDYVITVNWRTEQYL